MKDENKTKEQLMDELKELRQRIAGLEKSEGKLKRVEKELSETKQFLENIVDGISDGILLISKDFKILWANKALLDQTSYKLEEIANNYCYKVTHNFEVPCQPPHCLCPIDEMQKSGEPVTVIHTHMDKEGNEFFVEVTAYPIKDEKGETVQFIHLSKDITERKQAVEMLGESEKKYRLLIENLQEGIWMIDKDANTTFVNPRMAEMLGYTVDEMLGKHLFSFIDERGKEIAKVNLERRRQGIKEQHDFKFLRKDGTRIYTLLETSPIFDVEGNYFGALAGVLDITERKQMEKNLKETRDYLENLINYANAPIIVWNPALGITRFNHAFEHLTGYTADEVIGQNLSILFPEESRNESLRRIEQSASGEYWKSVEIPILRKDGDIRIALWNSANIYLEDGTLLATIAQGTNYTDRKLAEEELRESERKYKNLVENALVGVYKTNLKGDILYANEAMVKIFEFESLEELMSGSVLARYKNPKDREVLIENLKKEGTVENFETEVVTKTGKVRHIFLSATLDRDTISGMVRDITELKHTQEKLQRQLDHISALRTIDLAITASLDLRVTFNVFLDQVTTQLGVDAADILLFDPHIQKMEFATGRGFRTAALRHTSLSLGEGNAGRAAIERRIIHISNLREGKDLLKRSPLLDEEGFVAYYGVPLIAKGHVRGVLEIFHRSPLEPDPNWLDFLESLARQAAVAIDNASLFDSLQRSNIELLQSYDTTLEGWSRALDLRDKETEGHSERVTEITLRIARALGMVNSDLVHIRRGALLHDIGKMGISDRILLKPGPLTDEERETMQEHPVYSYELLSPIAYLRPAIDIPYCHHEKWDGTGYPRGLKGEQIPLSARIFAVVDVWDALLSDRPYRPAWPKEKTIKYIREEAGKSFDQKVVEVFLKEIAETTTVPS